MKHAVGNEILACAVALHDGLYQVFRHIRIICKKLLGVLGQAIAAVTERRIVVMSAYAWVEAYAVDDGLSVKSLHLGVSVKLVEVRHAQSQIRIGKQLHGFGFSQAHEQRLDILFYRSLLKQRGKLVCGLIQTLVAFRPSHNDATWIKVVVKRFALTQELWREYYVVRSGFLADALSVPDRNRAFYHHYGIGVDTFHKIYNLFHMACVKIVFYRIIICRCRNDDKIRIAVCLCAVKRGYKIQIFLGQIFLYVLILYGRLAAVYQVNLLGNHVYSRYMMMLA